MNEENNAEPDQEERSFLKVIVHSFFIIPFLIAVFCLLLFTAMSLLTSEKRTVFDYLEDVKTGSLNKRWQGAFELSKILSNPDLVPKDERFTNELISAYKHSKHDDNRIRQYLALAMGRSGDSNYLDTLLESLDVAKEENLTSIIYAIGMLRNPESAKSIHQYLDSPVARIRSITTVALGSIGNSESIEPLKEALSDSEPNVQWGAAISLAHMEDASGKNILLNLLNRDYYKKFIEVDEQEKKQLIIAAIEASIKLNSEDLNSVILNLSQTDSNMDVRSKALEKIENK